jgi:hypothetical protein
MLGEAVNHVIASGFDASTAKNSRSRRSHVVGKHEADCSTLELVEPVPELEAPPQAVRVAARKRALQILRFTT